MSGLFSSPTPATPKVTPPAPMPDPNAPSILEAKRNKEMDILSRAGRSSTILTAPANRPASDYSATKLGTVG